VSGSTTGVGQWREIRSIKSIEPAPIPGKLGGGWVSADWLSRLKAVLGADSLAAAQIAASELIDLAVPGGAAVDLSARSLVEILGDPAVGLAHARYRAYALSVLLAMGTWIRTWRRAATTNPTLASSAEEEAQIERALVDFCSANVALLDDPDDETRSMMSVLVGSVGAVEAATAPLMSRYDSEASPVVRAFIAQGLLHALGRSPEGEATELDWSLTLILADAPSEVVARANDEVLACWWTPEERARLLARVVVPASSTNPFHWPAEGV